MVIVLVFWDADMADMLLWKKAAEGYLQILFFDHKLFLIYVEQVYGGFFPM